MLSYLVVFLLGINTGLGIVLWSFTIREVNLSDEIQHRLGFAWDDCNEFHIINYLGFIVMTIFMVNVLPTGLAFMFIKERLSESRE
jgi:hypothetical protein